MSGASMRQKLHQYIDMSDERLLKMMYVLAKEYNGEYDDNSDYSFSDADIQIFEERRKKRLNGESKTFSWEDAKNIITGKKSA